MTVTPPFWRYDVEALGERRHLRRPRLVGAQATVKEDEGLTGSLLDLVGLCVETVGQPLERLQGRALEDRVKDAEPFTGQRVH